MNHILFAGFLAGAGAAFLAGFGSSSSELLSSELLLSSGKNVKLWNLQHRNKLILTFFQVRWGRFSKHNVRTVSKKEGEEKKKDVWGREENIFKGAGEGFQQFY